ncbi:MAG TPA: N-acetyltransferase [Fimbriiglobus sp.]|jgi:ribosomal protein S18 acetylase RimI-like enzyme
MNLTIRRADPADAGILAAFNQALASESEQTRLDPAAVGPGVTAVLTDPHKGFYTVAEKDGEVVGQCLVTYEWSDWRNGWFWWVQSVYVRGDARRIGVFRRLYEHIIDQAAKDPTVIGLRLYVERQNTRAIETYRSLGMVEAGYDVLELYPLPGESSLLQKEER